MLKVGVIGLGAIGRDLVAAIAGGRAGAAVCPAVLVRTPRAAGAAPVPIVTEPEAFFAPGLDAVVECAGHGAVAAHGEAVLRHGADLVVTAVGALAAEGMLERLCAAAEASGRRLIVPSAGIGALDILAGAAVGGLDRVVITVRKEPLAWLGTPAERAHDLASLAQAAVLFEGPVREGARLFPANVNISAAAALAGLGFDRTRLRVIADPAVASHVIEIEAEGTFGRFHFREEVRPSEENRKTGRIVAMALIKTVRQLSSTVVVGA